MKAKFDFFNPLKKAVKGPWGVVEWILLSVGIFGLLIMIPVWTTPGNDFLFQISIIDTEVLTIMIILSIINALLIKMQLYIRKEVKEKGKLSGKIKKKATAIGIIMSSITATVACAACYSSILALFGLGTTAFIVENRIWIALGAFALTSVAVFYSGKRINNHCKTCSVASH